MSSLARRFLPLALGLALGCLGLVLSLAMLFVRETPRRGVAATSAHDSGLGLRRLLATLGRALRLSPALGLTIGGGVALHFVLGAAAFDQLWLVQERGFERAEIARLPLEVRGFGHIKAEGAARAKARQEELMAQFNRAPGQAARSETAA